MNWLNLSAGFTENSLEFPRLCLHRPRSSPSTCIAYMGPSWLSSDPTFYQTRYFPLRQVMAGHTGAMKELPDMSLWFYVCPQQALEHLCSRWLIVFVSENVSLYKPPVVKSGYLQPPKRFCLYHLSNTFWHLKYIWLAETLLIPFLQSTALAIFTWLVLLLEPILEFVKASTQIQILSGMGLGTSNSFLFLQLNVALLVFISWIDMLTHTCVIKI